MNQREFGEWWLEHSAAFPSLLSWMENLGKKHESGEKFVAQVLTTWRNILGDVTLRDAIDATRRMARGDEPEPRTFDEYPRVIRRLANAARFAASVAAPVYRGNQFKPNCEKCNDRGQVIIWHPVLCEHLYRNYSDGEPLVYRVVVQQEFWLNWNRSGRPKTCAILCSCPVGEKLVQLRTKRDQDGRTEYRPPQLSEQHALYDCDNLDDARAAGKPQAVNVYDFDSH